MDKFIGNFNWLTEIYEVSWIPQNIKICRYWSLLCKPDEFSFYTGTRPKVCSAHPWLVIICYIYLFQLRKLIISLNKAKLSHSVPVQTIIASNTWNVTLEELVRQILRNPVICIASYLEAAIYARVKPVVGILKPDQKIHRLLGK